MNTINYIKFFDECLNHNMIVKELISVQEHIFKIVEFANKSNGYPMSYTSKINLCGHILDIFTKIIDNKKFDNLDEIVDFVLFLKPSNEAITNFIETIICSTIRFLLLLFYYKCRRFVYHFIYNIVIEFRLYYG